MWIAFLLGFRVLSSIVRVPLFLRFKKNRIVPLNEPVELLSLKRYSFLLDFLLTASSNIRQKLINVKNSNAVSLCLPFWVSEHQNLSLYLHIQSNGMALYFL